MSNPRLRRKRGISPREWRDLRAGLLFISPWIVGFCAFLAYPIVMSLYYSLCDFSVLQAPRFIGDSGLNTRNMFRNRPGRPRSLISSGGQRRIATNETR